MQKMILSLVALFALSLSLNSEDYQCGSDAGCKARITEDGEITETVFRKGDMVSTDAGWSVSTDDGWVKVKTSGQQTSGNTYGSRRGYVYYVAQCHIPASTSNIGVVNNTLIVVNVTGGTLYVLQPGLNDTGVLALAPYRPTTYVFVTVP